MGEAVEDAMSYPKDRILAGDLVNPDMLRRKLRSVRARKRDQLLDFCRDRAPGVSFSREWSIFDNEEVIESWILSLSRISDLGLVTPDSVLENWLRQTETVIFEGAQGVLLDADEGFHPYTTWSRSTAENALELINEMAPGASVSRVGVLRSYAVRHGPGPLPTETNELAPLVSEHNSHNEWQGAVRYGWFDAVLARYALAVTGGVDSLAVTHMDALPQLKAWQYCSGYKQADHLKIVPYNSSASDGVLAALPQARFLPLAQRAQLTQALFAVAPVLDACAADEHKVLQTVEALLGQPVEIISRGPSAENVQLLV